MKRFTVRKSENDPKGYAGLELENGLKLLIVSDPDCDKSAASVSIAAGSMNDPDDLPGLAHLCEHLLSIEHSTSEDFKPFNKFISENGGMFNAFTTREQTNFHFDIDPKVFPLGFQRFAKFFTTKPSLTEADISREIKIVDAEHASKVEKEAWRKMGVDANTCRPSHPYSKFTTGNRETLEIIPKMRNINVLKEAEKFREKYYVSNFTAVCIYAREDVNYLENLVIESFSKMRKNSAKLPEWTDFPFGKEDLKKRIDILSKADLRDFYIVFPIPNFRPFYKTMPHSYLMRLIGNRGRGSLYAYLWDKQWVELNYINASIPGRGFGEVSIGFQLTKDGMENVDEIISSTFQYLRMLQEKGAQEYFWDEMRQNMRIQYDNQDKEIAVNFVQRTSHLVHVYPLEDIVTIAFIVDDYNPRVLDNFLSYLNPDNFRVITVSKTNKGNLRDKWYYNAEYSIQRFSEDKIAEWKAACDLTFHLPPRNEFIANDFSLKNTSKKKNKRLAWTPEVIADDELCKAFYLPDNEFHLAKGVIRLEIFSLFPNSTPTYFSLHEIWWGIVKDMLSDEFFSATLAGAYHHVKPTMYGVEITISGFSDKLILLMETVYLKVVKGLEILEVIIKHFKQGKDRYKSGKVNLGNSPPQNISTYYLNLVLTERRFSHEQLLQALDQVRPEVDLEKYIKGFFQKSYLEWMIYGNFTREESKLIVEKCKKYLIQEWNSRAFGSENRRLKEICLPVGKSCFKKEIKSGNSCTLLFQLGKLNLEQAVMLDVIDQICYEPLFTQLRSEEQIGYVVTSSVRKSHGIYALQVFVQGDDKQPEEIEERIINALGRIESKLEKMGEAEFNQHKSSVKIRKSDNPKTMLQLLNKVWINEIITRRYDFSRIEKEIGVVEGVGKADVLRFFKEKITGDKINRKVLRLSLTKSIELDGRNDKIEEITDILEWKNKINLY